MKLTQDQIYMLMRAASLPDSPFRFPGSLRDPEPCFDLEFKANGFSFWLFWDSSPLKFKQTNYTTFDQMLSMALAWRKLHESIAKALIAQLKRDIYDSEQMALQQANGPYFAFGTKRSDYNSQAQNEAILGIGKEMD